MNTSGREISPMMLIVDRESYAKESGEDWETIQTYLSKGWLISLVHSDHRFPDHTFVVLENKAISP